MKNKLDMTTFIDYIEREDSPPINVREARRVIELYNRPDNDGQTIDELIKLVKASRL